MRPHHRGNGGGATTKLWLTISFIASFYVVGRLWSASTEINYLKDELGTVTKLAREQKEKLLLAEEEAGIIAEPLFYSVRQHPPKDIPHLKGPALNLDDIFEDVNDDQHIDDLSTQAAAVIAEVDLIEAGTVTGWACSRSSDVPGPLKIVIYVNRIQVAEVTAMHDVDLPASARFMCHGKAGEASSGAAPKGFVAKIPALPQGTHSLRAFVQLSKSGKKVEAHHSPAAFIESAIQPDGTEALRRKDAIILRRNAELVSILEEFKTQIPWKKAEAAAAAEENRLQALGGNDDENSNERLLALVLVHSEPKDHKFRDLARKTWVPSTPTAAQQLRESLNIAIKFITIMPAGASLQEPLRHEHAEFQDLIIVEEDNIEGSDAKKVLAALSIAIGDKNLDSSFYVVTRDTIVVDLEAVSKTLSGRLSQGNLYMGCMKSGDVVSNVLSQWDEPDYARFGTASEGGSAYPVHATKEFYVFSRYLGRYLARARSVLHSYKFEDTSMGAWLVGLEVDYIDDGKFCCGASDPCKKSGPRCIAYYESKCGGMCEPESEIEKIYSDCVVGSGKSNVEVE